MGLETLAGTLKGSRRKNSPAGKPALTTSFVGDAVTPIQRRRGRHVRTWRRARSSNRFNFDPLLGAELSETRPVVSLLSVMFFFTFLNTHFMSQRR